jgi:hypothetical protein
MTVTSIAQRKFFRERGYLSLGPLYTEAEVRDLCCALDGVLKRLPRDYAAWATHDGTAPCALVGEQGTVNPQLRDLHRNSEVFRRHAFHPTIAAAAAELMETDQVRL